MSKAGVSDQLDQAVEKMMAGHEAPTIELDARIAALLGVAAELRDLPRPDFKAGLKAELVSKSATSQTANYGKPVSTAVEINARLKEMAETPALGTYNVREAIADLPELTMRFLASMDHYTIGVSRYSTQQPLWERHPAGDELLHVLEGALDVTTLTAKGPVHTTVNAGSVFICPRNLWHWPRPLGEVSMFFLTAGSGTRNSRASSPPGAPRRASGPAAAIAPARDISETIKSLPELNITPETTAQDANAAVGHLGWLGDHALGVMRYSGQTPWERHPGGDELLHALDGEVDVTVLTDEGPVTTRLAAGSVFVCPRGLWHRQHSRTKVTMFYATTIKTSEVSFADDPRLG